MWGLAELNIFIIFLTHFLNIFKFIHDLKIYQMTNVFFWYWSPYFPQTHFSSNFTSSFCCFVTNNSDTKYCCPVCMGMELSTGAWATHGTSPMSETFLQSPKTPQGFLSNSCWNSASKPDHHFSLFIQSGFLSTSPLFPDLLFISHTCFPRIVIINTVILKWSGITLETSLYECLCEICQTGLSEVWRTTLTVKVLDNVKKGVSRQNTSSQSYLSASWLWLHCDQLPPWRPCLDGT